MAREGRRPAFVVMFVAEDLRSGNSPEHERLTAIKLGRAAKIVCKP
jgi:hypothetical protein